MVSNQLILEELQQTPFCNHCGSAFVAQEDVDDLMYSRTTASYDWFICPDCNTESVQIITKEPS